MDLWLNQVFQMSDQQVLYLDFDGVLHHENVYWNRKRGAFIADEEAQRGHKLFEYAPLLEQALSNYPNLKIVLSTSWAVQYGCAKAAKRLPNGLRTRVVGSTYHSLMHKAEFQSIPRGLQIESDARRRNAAGWVALDDDDTGWPQTCKDNLILTTGPLWLAAPGVIDLLHEKLERFEML